MKNIEATKPKSIQCFPSCFLPENLPSAETLRCPGGRRPSSPEAGVLLEGEPDPDLSALNLTAETASAGPVVQLNEDGQLIKH